MDGEPSLQGHTPDLVGGPTIRRIPDDDLRRLRPELAIPPAREELDQGRAGEGIRGGESVGADQVLVVKGVPGVVRPDVREHEEIWLEVPAHFFEEELVLCDRVAADAHVHDVDVLPL